MRSYVFLVVSTYRSGGRMACQPYCQGRRIRPYRKYYCRPDWWFIGRMVGLTLRMDSDGHLRQPAYIGTRSCDLAIDCFALYAPSTELKYKGDLQNMKAAFSYARISVLFLNLILQHSRYGIVVRHNYIARFRLVDGV